MGGGVVIVPGGAGVLETSFQVEPPSMLTCTFSPAPSAPLVPETVSVVSLVVKSPAVPVSSVIAVMSTAAVGAGVDGDHLAVGVADIGGRVDHPRLVGEARAVGGGVDIVQVVPASWTTSIQVEPPSMLTCTFSPAPSAPLVPETVSVVSLVVKSPAVPVSSVIAVMSTAAVGAGVDGHRLAVGVADIGGRVDHPRLVGEVAAWVAGSS